MFCPKCRQRRTFESKRFCSRCGLQLNAVAELSSCEDGLPNAAKEPQGKLSLLKQPMYRAGAQLIFLSLILLPAIFILSYVFDSPVPFIFPLLVFFAGLAQMTYTRIFVESIPPGIRENEPGMNLDKSPFNLPSSQRTPIPSIDFKGRNTEEIIRFPSVTEHTSKLLKSEDESSEP